MSPIILELHLEFEHLQRFKKHTRGAEWFTASEELLEKTVKSPNHQMSLLFRFITRSAHERKIKYRRHPLNKHDVSWYEYDMAYAVCVEENADIREWLLEILSILRDRPRLVLAS